MQDRAPDTARKGPKRSPVQEAARFSFGVLLFGFGIAAGFMLAFAGFGAGERWIAAFMAIGLAALLTIAMLGLAVYLFRKPLFRRVFGLAEAQLEQFSEPLAEVARGAVNRDPAAATEAARDLVHMALARYAWLSTRRWIIGSLTALIAAMAALAGTAMLFRQNELLVEQITRIDRQIVLSDQSMQLAEAARNSGLVAEIISIADALGKTLQGKGLPQKRSAADMVPVLDPLTDLDRGLITRIISASQATKPYRFLDYRLQAQDDEQMYWHALASRRGDFETIWRDAPAALKAQVEDNTPRLVDRPQSPERGQLFFTLTAAGVRDFALFNHMQMDLSFADARGIQLFLVRFPAGMLRFADLSYAELREADFGGAFLENVRFRRAQIFGGSFAAVTGEQIGPPFRLDGTVYATALAGADFGAALLSEVGFSGAHGLLADFTGAALLGPDFSGAGLTGASFRGTALLNPVFAGTELSRSDFDGALVLGAGFLEEVEKASAGTFVANDYRLEKSDIATLLAVPGFFGVYSEQDLERYLKGKEVYRVVRVGGGDADDE